MRRLFLRGGKGLTKGMGLSAVALLAALAPLVSSPVGLAAPPSLSGHIAASAQNFSAGPPTQANLTASGNEDWAIWGYAGGTSTSLAPDERKAGGNAISDLTDIQPGPPIARRGIGQFPSEVPFRFSWTDGTAPAPSASSVPAGLQHNTNLVDSSGYGFSFTVPASTVPQTLTVWAHAQGGVGRLTATLSDGSAPVYSDATVSTTGGHNAPIVYQLDFAAASAAQTLTVSWVLDEVVGSLSGGNSSTNNAALYAAALSTALPPPAIVRAVSNGSSVGLVGRVEGGAGLPLTLSVASSATCVDGVLGGSPTTLAPVSVTPGADSYFSALLPQALPLRSYVSVAVASPFATADSTCAVVGSDNDSWPTAFPLDGAGGTTLDVIDSPGQARWYAVDVTPGSKLEVTLGGLPADYDLAVFKDISQAYDQLTSPQDLTRLSAEFAPFAFSPFAFSPFAFSPSAISPESYSPFAFSPFAFSPSVFAPFAFSPFAFSPFAFSPSAVAPFAFSPFAFSPFAFSPFAFSPFAFSPFAFSPEAFASAQTRSLIAVSAKPGTADESLVTNTWNNTGRFYIRVAGRDGAFSTGIPFTVSVTKSGTSCTGVVPMGAAPASEPARGYRTLILTDSGRLAGSAGDRATLADKLASFAARQEIGGAVVDLARDTRVGDLDAQADANSACPYAKNLVAGAIKDVVDAYRDSNPGLRYVVLVGGDGAIPFFRYADESLLGQESDYVPPVGNTTASEASLRLDYVLGQDEYGASKQVSLGSSEFPLPDLAVGRLVETASDASGMLDAYTATGGVTVPHSSLVTGYDFLADAAESVRDDLAAATGQAPDTLITPATASPEDPTSWTASQLSTKLLGARHDLVFLAGHFSASSALAADFKTSLSTTDVAGSSADLANTIVWSAGCHSGYNLVDADGVPGVTQLLDWPQALARKKATLIAGTGYQYGDTDFLEFSERIYAGFARQLRTGTGAVSVGEALVRAKREYLGTTQDIRGIHAKALLEATVFGLPMTSVDVPGSRLAPPGGTSVIGALSSFATAPGAALGLRSFDLSVTPTLTQKTVPLTSTAGGSVNATYYRGGAGVVANPLEPALPLESIDVTPPDRSLVLRGLGWRGGTYSDSLVTPLTGAPTTELRGVHTPFLSPVFFPMRLAAANYFDALDGGHTKLLVTPAQHKASPAADGTSTLRLYRGLDLRLFYSGYLGNSALSAAPSIVDVDAVANGNGGVDVSAHVVGDPAAGVQQVWIVYTGDGPSRWAPLDLTQDDADSTLWHGTLPSIASPGDLRFVVEAVNGVGLVSLDDDLGAYYRAGSATSAVPAATTLALESPPSSGTFGGSATITALLSSAGAPLAGKQVAFSIGGSTRLATTDAAGRASAAVPLVSLPGATSVTAGFDGDDGYVGSAASAAFTVAKAATSLAPFPSQLAVVTAGGETGISTTLAATLGAATQPLLQRTVTFTLTGPAGSKTYSTITDYLGRATLPSSGLAAGTYSVTASFAGDATYTAATRAGTLVVSAFGGFLAPVDSPPVLNVAKGGSAVPVKFSLGGDRGLAIFAAGYPRVVTMACDTRAATSDIETTVTAGSSSLQYANGQYTYVWKTTKGWTDCRRLELKLVDGSLHTADFRFK